MHIFLTTRAVLEYIDQIPDRNDLLPVSNRKSNRRQMHLVRQKAESILKRHGFFGGRITIPEIRKQALETPVATDCLKKLLLARCCSKLVNFGLTPQMAEDFCYSRVVPEWATWRNAGMNCYSAPELYGEHGEVKVERAFQLTAGKVTHGFILYVGKTRNFLSDAAQGKVDYLLKQDYVTWPMFDVKTFYDANRNLGRLHVRIYRATAYDKGFETPGFIVGIGENIQFFPSTTRLGALKCALAQFYRPREARKELRVLHASLSGSLAQAAFTFDDARAEGLCEGGIRGWAKAQGFEERTEVYGHELSAFLDDNVYIRRLALSRVRKLSRTMQAAS